MPHDPEAKARVVVSKSLVAELLAEATRRGLGEKSPSALLDMIARAWLRSAPSPASTSAEGAAAAERRRAALEARIAALEDAERRRAALESEATSRILLEHRGGDTSRQPDEHSAEKEHQADTLSAPKRGRAGSGGGGEWTAEALGAAMQANRISASKLGKALGYRDNGRTVGLWRRGEKPIPPSRQERLSELLARSDGE